jgi:Leucine-rich repeat (LRR) protein/protocatechuate 3,4-dioxygenase beta subunit
MLIGNAFGSFVSFAASEKPVSSINLTIGGDVVKHAFGDEKYDTKYYRKIAILVTALFSGGASSNITKNSTFTSTDASIAVSPDGIVTGLSDATGYVIATYQNKQAAIKVGSNWDYVSGSYALNLVSQPTYGDLTKSKVSFKDPNLEIIVREHLNKPIGTITEEDMKQLTILDADYREINSLNGLQFAVNLEDLYVEGNQISDLSPLHKLTNLKRLWIGKNNLKDLVLLRSLTSLTELYAWENRITHLVGIENLKNLTILDVHNNEIDNIKSHWDLPNLSTLNLNNNKITNLTPLSKLTSLEYLELNHNQISDIKPLNQLNRLSKVDLKWNPLTSKDHSTIQLLESKGVYVDHVDYDKTPITFADPQLERALSKILTIPTPIKKGDLKGIHFLDLSNEGITNLKGLENATDLFSINLNSNFIKNMDSLLQLSQLNQVDISRNPIASDSLGTIQSLEDRGVDAIYDLIYDPTPVEFADSKLESLLSYGQPKPVTKGDLSKIDYLHLHSENLSNLKGLEHAKNLYSLSISRNNLTSISEIKNLDQLQYVDLTGNPVDTSQGSEASVIINELENKGAMVLYDVNVDPTPVDFADPIFESNLVEQLRIPSPITKGELTQIESLPFNKQQLNIPSRSIIRLDGIEHIPNLKSLFLNDNQISDLTPLASTNQLSEIHLRNNDITDIAPLLELTNLRYLDVRNNLFDASPDTPAGKIIALLQERGVKVDFDESSDTVVKGFVLDENNNKMETYSYITVNGNGKTYQTFWDPSGEFNLKLGEGSYSVTGITMKTSVRETFHPNLSFEIKDGKLYINGELRESLEVKLPPISLIGNIVDENGIPVANANVSLADNKGSGVTDEQGIFSLRLGDGTYKISNVSFRNEQVTIDIPFEIKDGKLYVDGELKEQLEVKVPPASLKGSVVDENGVPVANANVQVDRNNNWSDTNTDGLGNFTYRLGDGAYRISYVWKGNEGIQLNIPFEIKGGKLYVNGEIRENLEVKIPPFTFEGSVIDENGLPVANANVSINHNNRGYSNRTDSNGKFNFRLEDGRYNLTNISFGNESAPQNLVFDIKDGKLYVNGELKDHLEIKLHPVTMTGKLVDENGQSLSNAYIQVDRDNQGNGIHTDSEGKFSFRLDDGMYRVSHVSIKNEGISFNIPFEISEGKLFVNGEQKDTIEVKIPPVTFKGSVVDENGIPVVNAYVSVNGNNRWFGNRTDSHGDFNIRLEDGTYNLNNISFGNEVAPQNLGFEVKEGKLYVNGEPTEHLEVKLSPVTMTGKLVDENGQPLSSAYIQVDKDNKGFSTQTDTEGKFNFRLDEGIYRLSHVSIKNEGVSFNIPFVIREGKLFVNGEQKDTIEVKLPPVTLKGSVVDENEVAVENAYVSVNGNNRGYGNRTDSHGDFNIRLEDGTYNLNNISFGIEVAPQNLAFEIKEGKLYVNGELKEKLEVKLPPATLKGSLVDENGIAVSNANVQIERNNNWSGTNTDAQGNFTYRLGDGIYTLKNVSFKNEATPQNQVFEIKEGKLYVNGELKEQLEVKLPPVTLMGSLIDENGLPVANADVFVEVNNNGSGARTDEQGTFTHRLIDGTYRISYIRKGSEGIQQNIPFEIREGKLYINGGFKETLEVKLLPVTLKGSLVDENGSVIANANVQVEVNNIWYGTSTDAQGNFTYRLGDGAYRVVRVSIGNDQVSLNIPFEVRDGKLYVNGELKETMEVKLLPVTFKGSVVDENGLPVANVNVLVEGNNRVETQTDSQGKFGFRLADGKYNLHNFSFKSETAPQNLAFEIKDGKLYVNGELKETLEVKLLPVTLKGTVFGESGLPVPNAYVTAHSNNPGFGTHTDTQGNFSFRLADGTYNLNEIRLGNESAPQNLVFEIKEGKLYVNGELKEKLEIKLLLVTMTGRLVDENGLPIANARISVDGNGRRDSVNTDAEGNYSFRLTDGTYKVSYVTDAIGEVFLNTPFEIAGGKLLINGIPKDQMTITLSPITFKGSILDSNDTPIGGGDVYLFNLQSHYHQWSKVNNDGTFTGRLADGDYVLYKVNDILLNHKFFIRNGKMMVNDQPIDQLNIKMTNFSTINATLTENGLGIPNGAIALGYQNEWILTSFNTDSNGVANLSLQDGLYNIFNVWKDGNHIPVAQPIFFEIKDGKLFVNGIEQQTLQVEINHQQATTVINGMVKDATGPITNARVDLWSDSEQRNILPWTDGNGNFQVPLNDGEYRIQQIYTNGQHVNVSIHVKVENGKYYVDSQVTDFITIELPVVTLHGDLIQEGQPLPQAELTLREDHSSDPFTLRTDDQGHFMARLPDGDYTIESVSKDNVLNNVPINVKFKILAGKIFQDEIELTSVKVELE